MDKEKLLELVTSNSGHIKIVADKNKFQKAFESKNTLINELNHYKQIVTKDQSNHKAKVELAGIYSKLGNYNEAIGYYDQLHGTEFENHQLFFQKAQAYNSLNNS